MKIFVLAIGTVGCGLDSSTITKGSQPVVNAQNTPGLVRPQIRPSKDGKAFVRSDGWPIPPFGGAERDELDKTITTADGRIVNVHLTVIRTDPLSLYTDNPLYLIDLGTEKHRINQVKVFSTSAGVFCYRFLVNDAYVEPSTGEFRTRGILHPYSIYDEDGDAVFESLIISEEDRGGRKGFEIDPRLPDWTLRPAGS